MPSAGFCSAVRLPPDSLSRRSEASFRPRLATVALALSLGLHLHQVGRGTCTPKLLSMPSTLLNRYAAVSRTVVRLGRTICNARWGTMDKQAYKTKSAFSIQSPMAIVLPNPSGGLVQIAVSRGLRHLPSSITPALFSRSACDTALTNDFPPAISLPNVTALFAGRYSR
jgi:hypothetical protein